MKKRIIWQSMINLDDWEDYFREDYPDEELTEQEKYSLANDTNNEYLEDERHNLDINLIGDIIAIGTIGTWCGRFAGYREMNTKNIGECLHSLVSGYSEIEWFVENGNFKANEYHHDGANYYTYRQLRQGLTDSQIDHFFYKLYNGKATARDIRRYTLSLAPAIQKVYGW